MNSKKFDQENDVAPTPFSHRHTEMAEKLKETGLPFHPHVGCFVWDPQEVIKSPSPFPNRIYFILSLQRFLDIFGNKENIKKQLVWLPTWHQARVLCEKMDIGTDQIASLWQKEANMSPGEDLLAIYSILYETLKKR
ncbi:MAG: hypothetical protein U5K27_00455 [Desulfotignum sp.]|nr:hypothetical protein [Desulfotignum sp.]